MNFSIVKQSFSEQSATGTDSTNSSSFVLQCKENLPPTLPPKSHTSTNQPPPPLTTPPSSLENNVLPALACVSGNNHQSKVARKPLPFASASPMGQAQGIASVLGVQQTVGSPSLQLQQELFILPTLSWTDSTSLWQKMRAKDTCKPAPEADLHLRHPCILPSMRTILLDWMLEVCIATMILLQCLLYYLYIYHATAISACMFSSYSWCICKYTRTNIFSPLAQFMTHVLLFLSLSLSSAIIDFLPCGIDTQMSFFF